jgi:hypothetical protein
MKTMKIAAPALALSLLLAPASLAAIEGDYLEVRTADVYTGPCFANGEVNLAGRDAVLAWHVKEGSWNGARLDGLNVVAVVRASATLGDPHANPLPAKALVIVDERATGEQRAALESLARDLGGALTEDVVRVVASPVELTVDAPAAATLLAGDAVEVRTRALAHCDRHCGNEEVFYPPLTRVDNPVPAVSVIQAFRGDGLGATWYAAEKRSAFLATFSR